MPIALNGVMRLRIDVKKTLLPAGFDDGTSLIAHLLDQLDLAPERQCQLLSSATLSAGQAPFDLRLAIHGCS